MSEPRPHAHRVPTRVGGRYVLHDEVGRGGMATVWRAHDETLDRPVAVKLLHSHLATDPAFLDRFRREARAAAALAHPNVVAVHDWGETGELGAYLVLHLVEGPSLRDVLARRGHLTPAEARAIVAPAADGLGAAHRAGLVHRDVKPENVLLGRDGTVRVTDFGLARAAASATSTFGAEVLIGSPHYLSPEAVRQEPLDPRADVYALGVMLYECLTGRRPHEGDSPFATAVAHTAKRVPAPSASVEGVPAELDALVLRATAIDRDLRPADAGAFAAALRAALPDGEVSVQAVGADVDRTATLAMANDAPPPPGAAGAGSSPTVALDGDHRRRPGEQDRGTGRRRSTTAEVPVRDRDTARVTDDRRRRRLRRGLLLLVLLGLVGGSAAGGYLVWDRVLAPVVPVPGVLGAAEASAVDTLQAAGFEVDVADDRPHDLAVAAGHVLDQTPTTPARTGTTVTLVLSAGPRPVEIAEVAGEPRDAALGRLESDGLRTAVVERHDEQVPHGHVVTTEPAPGTVVPEADVIRVVVSLGREPVPVPDVVGSSVDDAAAAAEAVGLRVAQVDRRFDESAPAGVVLEQTPEPGATRFRDDEVAVVVSRGPEPIEIPNVRRQRLDEAVTTLEGLGFEVEVERRGGLSAIFNPGRVIDQDPGPGATRRRGDTVLLFAYED